VRLELVGLSNKSKTLFKKRNKNSGNLTKLWLAIFEKGKHTLTSASANNTKIHFNPTGVIG
jgi:hypothetical protein